MFDLDPVPELPGPQGPLVMRALRDLKMRPSLRSHGVRFTFLQETLRDFAVVCQDLDLAESEYQRQLFASFGRREAAFDEDEVATSTVRARLINYFHHGYSLLDAVADLASRQATAKPWIKYAKSLEASDDQEARSLARVLTFRLREPRHIIAAHRKGWRAPVLLIGAGTASMSRRPLEMPAPDPEMVANMVRAYESVGLERPRNASKAVSGASFGLSARAPRCDETVRILYTKLINAYGIQTAPVSRITPALVAILDRVTEG